MGCGRNRKIRNPALKGCIAIYFYHTTNGSILPFLLFFFMLFLFFLVFGSPLRAFALHTFILLQLKKSRGLQDMPAWRFVSGFALSNFFLGSWEVAKGQYFYCEAMLPLTFVGETTTNPTFCR